jgi:hypothetical protein
MQPFFCIFIPRSNFRVATICSVFYAHVHPECPSDMEMFQKRHPLLCTTDQWISLRPAAMLCPACHRPSNQACHHTPLRPEKVSLCCHRT